VGLLSGRNESRKAGKDKLGDVVEKLLAVVSDNAHPIEQKRVSDSKGSIIVKPEEIRNVASVIKSNLDGAIGETVVGVDLQNNQYELIYFFWSLTKKIMFEVRTAVEGVNPSTDSICDLFPGLNWHEREIHEMFGISFQGHPNMNLLILPDELEGAYPLRKSYQVTRERVKESGIFTPVSRAAKPAQAPSEADTADGGKS
jgi:NADH:ubiquinone oxidoreductase subunit C